jgi:hypothetical protein
MVDRVKQAKDLLIEQYKDAANLNGVVESGTIQIQSIDNQFLKLLNERGLDTAVGVNLDIIGKIVVLDRPFTDPDPEDIFTFENPADIGGGFTDEIQSQQGGYYIGLDPIDNQQYNDSLYRFILKAKIIFNTTNATLKDMHEYAAFVFNVESSITERVGAIDLNIARPIGKQERQILEQTFPLAAGIRLGSISFSTMPGAFGFEGDDRNKGFGDLTDSDVGGELSSLVID